MTESRTTAALKHADLTGSIIAAFYAVYDQLGYGFLEKVYCAALVIELTKRGHSFIREAVIDVYFHGEMVGHFRADFIVEETVVIEAKASKALVEEGRN